MRNDIYKAFGLKIVSEIPLPELSQMNEKEVDADVQIEITDLSEQWGKYARYNKKNIVVEDDVVMFHIPQTAIFFIQDGNKITYFTYEDLKKIKFDYIFWELVWGPY